MRKPIITNFDSEDDENVVHVETGVLHGKEIRLASVKLQKLCGQRTP